MAQQGDYKINYEPLSGPLQLIDVHEAIKRADHPWYNQTLIEVGGVLFRLGVFAGGEYHWHKHQGQDEFFYVIDGRLRLELKVRDPLELAPGMAFSVRAGCCTARWRWSPPGADDRGSRRSSHRRLTCDRQ